MPGFVAAGSTRWRLELAAKPAVEVDGDGASDDMLDSTILVVKGVMSIRIVEYAVLYLK